MLGIWDAADGSCLSAHLAHNGLIGTTGRDLHRLCVQVRTRSKSIESSFNRIAVNFNSM